MHSLAPLIEGYRRFRESDYAQHEELYRELFEQGQSPETMIIACCDSRADPAMIFAARPGDLFVVRNVANLVPPCEPGGHYHGTSSAVEFAIKGLGVRNIVVLGHARCGGIQAFLQQREDIAEPPAFIAKWLSLVGAAHDKLAGTGSGDATPEELQRRLEHASIRNSLDNLMTFPFIAERVRQGRLELHGAYFSIGNGRLLTLDKDAGTFTPVSDEPVSDERASDERASDERAS